MVILISSSGSLAVIRSICVILLTISLSGDVRVTLFARRSLPVVPSGSLSSPSCQLSLYVLEADGPNLQFGPGVQFLSPQWASVGSASGG